MDEITLSDDIRAAIERALTLAVAVGSPDETEIKLTFSDVINDKLVTVRVEIQCDNRPPF